MSSTSESTYQQFREHVREIGVLSSLSHLLAWDERTQMPEAGAEYRAEQATLIATLIHRRATDPKLGDWLDALGDSSLAEDPHSVTGANIRRVRRQYDRQTKVPESLVAELAKTGVLAQAAWVKARADDDYPSFRPWLAKMLELKRQQAEAIGYDDCPYDALLDEYEPDMSTKEVSAILSEMRDVLVPLIEEIRGKEQSPDDSVLRRSYPADRQKAFAIEMAKRIGFDFDRGRLDPTTHPFCCRPGARDIRITTRYNERFFNEAFFGTMHEAGHGIYEQGLPVEEFGLPAGESVSLGIHESQSRMWENFVGRSRAFWEMALPEAKHAFPETLADVDVETFFRAVNRVEPSLIRVEADEATYNLHILVRFEMERELLSGDLSVDDAPEAWNSKYNAYLGITPPNDRLGILQDTHWSQGAIGYFATYSLGNLFAAELFSAAQRDVGPLAPAFTIGNFAPLLRWLRGNVHAHGQRYSAMELVEKAAQRPVSSTSLSNYLREKLASVYNL